MNLQRQTYFKLKLKTLLILSKQVLSSLNASSVVAIFHEFIKVKKIFSNVAFVI